MIVKCFCCKKKINTEDTAILNFEKALSIATCSTNCLRACVPQLTDKQLSKAMYLRTDTEFVDYGTTLTGVKRLCLEEWEKRHGRI